MDRCRLLTVRKLGPKLASLAAATVLCTGGLLLVAEPASASVTSLYAYANGGASSPASCPKTTKIAEQCSLSEALGLVAAGGTVALATPGSSGYYYGNFSLDTSGTSASAPVTIASAAKGPTLDGNGRGTVLSIASGVFATVDNVTIQEGDNAAGNGGGIDDGGSVDLVDATVTHNSALDGGGVYVANDAALTATASNISNDSATDDGGAIDNGTGTVTVAGSVLWGDSATGDGGAIDSGDNGGTGSLTVTASDISNDSATYDGGAIDSGDNGGTGNLTVTGSTFSGDSAANGADGDGGAIDSGGNGGTGSLTVTGSTFSGDSASWVFTYGGAIDSGDNGIGTATVSNSTFSDDSADGFGGGGAIDSGLAGSGILTVTNSTFSNDSTNGFGEGGAIDSGDTGQQGINQGTGMLTVTGSTFSGDSSNEGGAIVIADNGGSGTAAVSASTFSGDYAYGGGASGGAIDVANGGNGLATVNGTLTVTASTFWDDSAGAGGGIDNGYNPGLPMSFGDTTITDSTFDEADIANWAGSVTLAGTIVAGSSSGNCAGSITDAGFNLEDDASASCGFSSAGHDLVGVDPGLQALGSNGGPTETMEPEPTSPVLDQIPDPTSVSIGAGSVSLCSVKDQRGVVIKKSVYGCAIGSVQMQNTSLPIVTAVTPASGPASGTLVKITGVGLEGATSVSFGSTTLGPSSIVSDSRTSIKIDAPPGTAGTVAVTVTTPSGISPYRPEATFTYLG